jgi:hypothetical protein
VDQRGEVGNQEEKKNRSYQKEPVETIAWTSRKALILWLRPEFCRVAKVERNTAEIGK